MKNCLLFLAVVGVMMLGAPAYSQYLFLDSGNAADPKDGKNSLNIFNPFHAGATPDVLSPAVTSVDVYFVTNENQDGSPEDCGAATFQTNSYEFILRSSGSGSVAYGAWTDNMSGYLPGTACGQGDGSVCQGGTDVWVAKFKFTYDAPGKYRVGTLGITVTGTPVLSFATSSTLHAVAQTSLGSDCPGEQGDNTLRLGMDFPIADGTAPTTPVTSTTWGKIKSLYQ